ncbi:unnamed protein product [Symbiodinium sp. CCMP2592]|nr:unnamed protein product [Symbiodinium sp. CCMP2592]
MTPVRRRRRAPTSLFAVLIWSLSATCAIRTSEGLSELAWARPRLKTSAAELTRRRSFIVGGLFGSCGAPVASFASGKKDLKSMDDSADLDRLGSMLEKKWEKVKPACTSVGSIGIKAGYGVSKKDQLESIVRCDEPDTKSEKKDAAR